MSWQHSICDLCYSKEQPGRDPIRLKEAELSTCCFCGELHDSGIYYRKDPQLTLCKGSCSEEQQ